MVGTARLATVGRCLARHRPLPRRRFGVSGGMRDVGVGVDAPGATVPSGQPAQVEPAVPGSPDPVAPPGSHAGTCIDPAPMWTCATSKQTASIQTGLAWPRLTA